MPKAQTNKSAAKRIKVTAKGKLKFSKAGSGHLLSSKSRKRKRNLRQSGVLSPAENKRIKKLLAS